MGRVFDGQCRICEETYTGQGMSSHIKRCLKDHANLAAIHHGLLVGVRADGEAGRFWMHLLVRPEASLEALDDALREIWFDGGEATSVFDIEQTRYVSTLEEPQAPEEDGAPALEPLGVDIGAVIRPRMEFGYLYDPQAPTELELTVYDPYPCPAKLVDDESEADVVVAARNTLEGVACSTCENEAGFVCSTCVAADEIEEVAEGDDDDEEAFEVVGPFVCEECRAKHEGHEVRALVNTPRTNPR